MSICQNNKEISTRLICNNKSQRTKVISEIVNNLSDCDSFDLSVAFIGESGLASLRQILLQLREKGKKGRIVTSTYLGFNAPNMFRQLLELTNIEVRIYPDDGFHPKGYIFNYENESKIVIGSSNLTQTALTENQEWNVCLSGHNDQETILKIKDEFEQQWQQSNRLTEKWIEDYQKVYIPIRPKDFYTSDPNNDGFKPNRMQEEALINLQQLRKNGKDKALLISATGTGKTFLSAFDVKQFEAKKVLFVVHRENIARKAMESFELIIPNKKYGIFTGNEKDRNADYIFSTIQTIGKEEYYSLFKKDEFDYIIIDEVHHAAAESYRRLLSYFTPKFLLGMTATPERSDAPKKVYDIFEYNIAYEIRLQQAMEYDLLCPFHYYGISDLTLDNKQIDDLSDFELLTDSQRVDHVLNAINDYHYSGEKVHGLIFVSRVQEAKQLSKLFNNAGYKTVALCGEDSEEYRQECINRLEKIDGDYLDYIFTVDIFNEGVDIPSVNQVIMLRPTQSAIIFVQQLGRGLRKTNDKEFVSVIDVIGNYNNNFMIPIALSGSNSYNKDTLRRFVYDGNSMIYGCSTVSFDEISTKRILEKVDSTKFDSMEILKGKYNELKAKLGRIPTLADYDRYDGIDPLLFINKTNSYHNFLSKKGVECEYNITFNSLENKYLDYISVKFAAGKRIQELVAIQLLLCGTVSLFKDLKKKIKDEYNFIYNDEATEPIIKLLTGTYAVGSSKDTYRDVVLIEENGNDYTISKQFKNLLNNDVLRKQIKEVIDFGIDRYKKQYSDRYLDTDFVLYQKYLYDDVFRLLNWKMPEVSLNVGGYKYDSATNTFPIFVNYDKEEAKKSIKYHDHFSDHDHFLYISKHPRTIESNDAKIIQNAARNNTKIHLFARRNNKDETKEFYYLGEVELDGILENDYTVNGEKVFKMPFKLEHEVRDDIYSYLVG